MRKIINEIELSKNRNKLGGKMIAPIFFQLLKSIMGVNKNSN
jgi:hypothetical protein